MAASFPATLWVWTDQIDNTSAMDAADVNAPAAEIIAMQSHFGAGSIVAGQIILNSAAGVDTWISLETNSVEKWRFGSDESDSEKFKIHTGALADPSLFEMDSTGHIELTNAAETASDPGRHLYLQRVHTSTLGSGKGLTGVEVRSTFNGSADALNSEVKGGEFKARHTTGNTYDVGTFKGVIGNVDCKNGTVTTGWAVEGAIDVSSGGTFTTAACFHGNLNNSGTVTNSYGVYVHGLSGNVLTRGLYVDYATTGIYLENCTTDIRFQNGATIANSTSDLLTITEATIATVGKLQFGGATDWGTGATGTLIDGSGYDWVSQTVGHIDANLNNTAAAAAYHALTVGASQTGSNSCFGIWTELYIKNSVDLTGADNFAAIWGQFEAGTSVTLADTGCFTAAFYGNVKAGATLVIASGHAVNGCRVQAEISAVTNNGRLAAFECLKSGGVDWEYGLYIANATTGINIGACTTGINFSSTLATGISFYNATFVPDASRTDMAFEIGSRANELTVNLANAASQNFEPFQMNINLTATGGAPTSTSTVRLIRARSTHDTTDMANLRIMNINTYMDVRKNIQAAYGQMNGVDFYTNAVAVTTEAAVGVFNMECNSAVTGNVRGVIINLYGAGLPSTTSIGVEVRTDGGSATLAEGIRIWSVGANSITTGIKFDGTITTGIEFASTTTNCISIPASTTGITKLIRVGTWGNDVKLAADDEFIELLCQVSGATHSKPLVRFRMEGDSTTDMTTGDICALETLAYNSATYDALHLTGLRSHCGFKGTSNLLTTGIMRAAYLKVEDLGEDVTFASGSYVAPLWMEMQFNSGSTFSGNMYWVSMSKYGSETSLYGDAVFRFEDLSGGGWATNLIEMDYGRAPFSSGGASGATNSDAKLRCDIGGTHYSIALYAE